MKNKVKKIPKKTIIACVICSILFGTIGVGATTLLYSKDVTYDNSSSGLSSTNLQDALDELYEQAKNGGASVSCDDDNNCTVTCKNGKPTITDSGYTCSTTTTVTCPNGLNYVATSTGYKCKQLPIKENIITSGDGLYADSIENGRYFYRGANPDNYITFNGESAGWRIISVESDGTIKIMKISSLGNMAWDTAGNRSTTGYCHYASGYGCSSWGSSSTMLDASGTVVTSMPREYGGSSYALPSNEASLNTYLNGTYYNSLSSTAQSKIVSHNFNVGVLKWEKGQTTATDVTQESTYKWKGKIALANASDYVRASTNSACTGVYEMMSTSSCYNNSSSYNWMFNSANGWTLSPYSNPSDSTVVWTVTSNGSCGAPNARNTYGIRPVLHLSADITLSGSGTQSDPYTIN